MKDGGTETYLFAEEKFVECFEWFRGGAGNVTSEIAEIMHGKFVENFETMFNLDSSMGQDQSWAKNRGFLLVNSEKLGKYAREYAVITKESIDKAILKLQTETCDAMGISEEVRKRRGGWCKVEVNSTEDD